jgi:hypothetical protein
MMAISESCERLCAAMSASHSKPRAIDIHR